MFELANARVSVLWKNRSHFLAFVVLLSKNAPNS